MVKLKRLKIHKFRNVAQCEMHFDDKVNVLLGKNATGKTTLLNMISQIIRTGLPAPLDEEFRVEYDLVSHSLATALVPTESKVTVKVSSLKHKGPQSELQPDGQKVLPLPPDAGGYDFDCDVRITSAEKSITIRQNAADAPKLRIGLEDGTQNERTAVAVNEMALRSAIIEAIQPLDESHRFLLLDVFVSFSVCSWAYRFDESLDVYRAIVGDGTPSVLSPKLIAIRNAESKASASSVFTRTGLPDQMCALLIGQSKEGEPDKEFRLSGTTAPEFLKQVTDILHFKDAGVQLSRLEKRMVDGKREEYIYGNLRFSFVKKNGSEINHSLLSYGQKRLLGFYYYLAVNEDVVIADELVNGFHHAWIETCLHDMGERQAFLTSQNPLLLDCLPLESAEHAQGCFIACSLKEDAGGESMCWENMSQAGALELYQAYEVGIQHVGDILRTHGLW